MSGDPRRRNLSLVLGLAAGALPIGVVALGVMSAEAVDPEVVQAAAEPALELTAVRVDTDEPEAALEEAPLPPIRSSLLAITLPSAPGVAPGIGADLSDATLDDVRGYLVGGDTHRALRAAEALVERERWGRDRDAAWMLIGLLHREAERHNLSSEAFTKVRTANGPLAPYAAYYEAEQDLRRGRPWATVKECERYRETWPEGPHLQACDRLTARAYAVAGNEAAARQAAEAYDAEHTGAPIGEQIELILAQRDVRNAPDRAVRRLRALAVEHRAPLTGRVAEELLAELRDAGHEDAVLPDDLESLKVRAISLRDSGRRVEARAAFQELVRRAEDDPALTLWIEGEAERFAWRTRSWSFLADWYGQRYDANPNGADAWGRYRALSRGGRWEEAAAVARLAQEKHGGTREWRHEEEDVARVMLLAGDPAGARAQYDAVRARGGWAGRRASFYAAFAAHRAGDHADAVERFDAIVEEGRSNVTESVYWRAKSLAALGRSAEAERDRRWVLENDPRSWYGLLLAQDAERVHALNARNGTWPAALPSPLPEPVQPAATLGGTQLASWAPAGLRTGSAAFSRLSWPLKAAPAQRAVEAPIVLQRDPLAPPPSYRESALYDLRRAEQSFRAYADRHAETWPALEAVRDLARAGLYDLSGPLLSEVYEDWREAAKSRRHPRHEAAREARLQQDEWRELFLFARDHYHTTRFTLGLEKHVEEPVLRREAVKLAWPLAHDRYVWTHARENGIDPYMVLGLMRQESVYNAIAVSRVGARGAMQIMPRTGHLLADLAHDTAFTAGDLEDPVFSVGYGITYLGLLMDRFEGAWPLAIAAYNGGPHNVSSWLQGTGADIEMDAFVEQIPFRETRHYVKVVGQNYATYLSLYEPEADGLVIPSHPRGDHAEIVDF